MLPLLEPDPGRRPGQAHALAARLSRILGRSPPPGPPRSTVFRPSLLARDAVLREAMAQLERRGSDVSGVAFVGPSGVGRTRVLLEVVREARTRRRAVVVGSGDMLVDRLLGRVEGLLADGRRDGPLPPEMAPVRWLRPTLARWCPTVEQPVDPEAARARHVAALHATARWLAGPDPLVLVVDDLRRDGSLAWDWIGSLLRGVRAEPVPARVFLGAEATIRGAVTLQLGALDEEATGRMAAEMLGDPAAAPRLGPRIHLATRGVPAAVAAVVQGLAAHPGTDPDQALPSVEGVVEDRLTDTSALTRRVCGAAAVLGPEARRLAEALELEPDEVAASLQELVVLDLLRVGVEGALAFRDDDHRRTALQQLAVEERGALHRWAAQHWSGPLAPALAHHLEGCGDATGAIGVWRELLDVARRTLDPAAALVACRHLARLRPDDSELALELAWAA
ncbi:MAG: ATP-binding protein, partial [Myxococcales bacterium]|nr:ATP-binding protein [Myxococcales bacterium]